MAARETHTVSSLCERQAAFGRALLADEDVAVAGVRGDGLAPIARLRIYRHHVLTSLTQALKDIYPVVCRLVDERFFAFAVDRYIRTDPPTGPCLFEYGATFPGFLASFPPCQDLVYLPDVAHLEWAINCALHAGDGEPIDPASLARVPADGLMRLTVRLHPSLSYIASPWPIDRIWHANQPGADPEVGVDLGAGGVRLEVGRWGDDVLFRELPPPVYALRQALAHGLPLGRAAEAALAVDPDFDLAVGLGALLDEKTIVSLIFHPREEEIS